MTVSTPGHRYAYTHISSNSKLGGLPATTTSKDSCPITCSYNPASGGSGCYASYGPSEWQWRKLDDPNNDKALDIHQLAERLSRLRKHTLFRHNQAGDLPGNGLEINPTELELLVDACGHADGFGFSHYRPDIGDNAALILAANQGGLTINMSAENLTQADGLVALGIGPVVVALPAGQRKAMKTPAGNHVAICPTYLDDRVTCASCGICQKVDRRSVVGFPAHGVGKAKVERIFWAKAA
jgi:hypothetical protein